LANAAATVETGVDSGVDFVDTADALDPRGSDQPAFRS